MEKKLLQHQNFMYMIEEHTMLQRVAHATNGSYPKVVIQ